MVRRTGFLSMQEIKEAETDVVKMIQLQAFPKNATYISGLRVSQDDQDMYVGKGWVYI